MLRPGIVVLPALVCVLGTSTALAETPGVLWRESFDGSKPIIVHWHGAIGKKVPQHGIVTEDGRRAEHLNIVYEARGDDHDYWRVKGTERIRITETTAVRLTSKSNSPVQLKGSFKIADLPNGPGLDGPTTKGTGAWETIEFRDILKQTRRTAFYMVRDGRIPEGADKLDMFLDVIALNLLNAGNIMDVFVDEIMVVDTAVYIPEADTASLPFRVAWATKTARPPAIDGRITDDDGWPAAQELNGFSLLGDGAKDENALARVLYNDQALYIAMHLDGPAGDNLRLQAKKRDDSAWNDDSVEVFVAPTDSDILATVPEGSRYFHLSINAAGVRHDTIGALGPASWTDEGWSAETWRRVDGWDIEIRVPFSSLGVTGPPTDVWTINLCRSFSSRSGMCHSTWSPLAKGFHEPDHFGRLAFGQGRPEPAVMASIVLREALRTRLGAPRSGLASMRDDLASIPGAAPGKEASKRALAGLSERVDALAAKIVALAPGEVLDARPAISDAIDAVLHDIEAARLAAAIVRLGAKTRPDWPFIVIGGPAITDERFAPGRPVPPSFDVTDRLSVTACPGEYESAAFLLYATEPRAGVRVSAGDLAGPVGCITRNALDIKVVKYWFQAGVRGYSKKVAEEGGVLVPELLLKDDGLVVVDLGKKKNYVRTTDGLVDISDPTVEWDVKGRPLSGITPKLLNLAPRDADELQPFDAAAGEFKHLFLTVHVPEDAPSGVYEGKVCVEVFGGGSITLPLSLKVLPFDLVDTPIDYSIYYRGALVDGPTRYPVWSERKSPVQFRAEMAQLLAHGIANPLVNERNFESFKRAMRIREEIGMPKGHIYNIGFRIPKDELDSDDALVSFVDAVKPFVAWAKENGYESLYVYGIDEDDPSLPEERRWIEALHGIGARVFVAVNQDGAFFGMAGDILDMPNLPGPYNHDMVTQVHDAGHRISIYAYPQIGSETPETYRRNYGPGLWQAGYDTAMTWAYQCGYGHIWNDFDGTHKARHFGMPTVDGVIDTLPLVGFREAVDDTRYAATLAAVAAKAKDNPTKREKALAADKWIRTVKTRGEPYALRRVIIARIVELLD